MLLRVNEAGNPMPVTISWHHLHLPLPTEEGGVQDQDQWLCNKDKAEMPRSRCTRLGSTLARRRQWPRQERWMRWKSTWLLETFIPYPSQTVWPQPESPDTPGQLPVLCPTSRHLHLCQGPHREASNNRPWKDDLKDALKFRGLWSVGQKNTKEVRDGKSSLIWHLPDYPWSSRLIKVLAFIWHSVIPMAFT